MPTSKRGSLRFSLASLGDEPDRRQMDYEDMFKTLVPQSERHKRTSKSLFTRHIPSLSAEEYLDQMLFYSRTKPLPPLPEDERPYKAAKSSPEGESETSSWSNAVRRWKHHLRGEDESSRSTTPKIATRQSSVDSTASKASSSLRTEAQSGRSPRFRGVGLMPWTTPSTGAANRHSMMYGDLAEFPPTRSKAPPVVKGRSARGSNSHSGKTDRKRSAEEAHGGRAGSRMAGERKEGFPGANETDQVSREDWEYLWRQYQHQSQLMQEALRQRTSELV